MYASDPPTAGGYRCTNWATRIPRARAEKGVPPARESRRMVLWCGPKPVPAPVLLAETERLMIRISKLAASVQPSATLAAGAKARQLRAGGVKVFDFSLGEPDFDTPKHICQAAEKAALGGQTHYTPTAGTAEVKAAVVRWYKKVHGYEFGPENVIVSN